MTLAVWVGCSRTGRPLTADRVFWHADSWARAAETTGLFRDHGGAIRPAVVARALMRLEAGAEPALRHLVAEAIRLGGEICYG